MTERERGKAFFLCGGGGKEGGEFRRKRRGEGQRRKKAAFFLPGREKKCRKERTGSSLFEKGGIKPPLSKKRVVDM